MQTVLTIAGFDPSSGAGITADLMVFAAHGLFGTSCITSLTVQSTLGVEATHPVSVETVRDTLDCLHDDLPAAGIKLGMLATAPVVAAVVDFLTRIRSLTPRIPVVLDPVLRSTSGRELLSHEGLTLLQTRLLPLVDWITPNLAELSILTGLPVTRREDLPPAAQALQQKHHGLNILATTGHLNPPDDLLLTNTGELHWLPGEHIPATSTHGTGCTLSSALLSRLVLGDDPHDAAQSAKQYTTQAIRTAPALGHGHGPLNHLWPLRHP
jgi:hydroxymethylpyrimidine/phosphomethylpyrimidine kinase